ncbi:MAG: allantoinase PuuE [Afipia felis]|nr:allantoinase PuuE [Afipia felis]
MSTKERYPRDLIGYGVNQPVVNWPGKARIAVQFVVNYEEGGENCILHGDPASEAFLSEISGAQPWPGRRHMNMESIYEYGSRAGFWRLHRLFADRNVPVTVFGVTTALARNPTVVSACHEAGWEIACHGYKWIDYKDVSFAEEKEHFELACELHKKVTGQRPLGWYLGRCSEHTLDIVMKDGSFLYSADSYADDLPYWVEGPESAQLMVPYTLDANDMRFATPQGFNAGDQFYNYLVDSFDTLYREGETAPKMMSIGLHCRLAGRPGRAASLRRFIDYVMQHENVWFARRVDIARHWIENHPPANGMRPDRLSRALFLERFGDVYEHTPEIASIVFERGITSAHVTPEGLHGALSRVMWRLSTDQKRLLLNAHPDLAGRLALAGELTTDSKKEQAGAGLDQLTAAELHEFTKLNDTYQSKFGFPFIIAVKGMSKQSIIESFRKRVSNDTDTEFQEALRQVDRIAMFRVQDRLRV